MSSTREKNKSRVKSIAMNKGTCPATMHKNRRTYAIAVACGNEQLKLQAPWSDVSLEIPKEASGVFFSHVHTDHTLFKNVIPDDECFVGPPVEFEQLNNDNSDLSKPFKIKIPHCIRHDDTWRNIKVRFGNIHKTEKFKEVVYKGMGSQDDIWYETNAEFTTIYTKHFSHFTCSVCNYNCSAITRIYLYGKLSVSLSEPATRVKTKVFLSSELYIIKDYKEVSIFTYDYFR